MGQRKEFDLTEGGILKKLLLIAIPIMGTQLFQMLYNLTDMFFLGQVSSDAVAASGTAGMYLWLSVAFFLIGRMGAEIGVSQSLGRSDEKQAQAYAMNSLGIAIVSGTLFAAVMILFSHPLIAFFQIQESHVARDAAEYLAIVAVGIPMTFISTAINGVFNGAGNSKLPFYINAFAMAFNVIISPIFIFSLNLGIHGAAIATVIAQTVSAILFLIAFKYHGSRPFQHVHYVQLLKPQKDVMKQILKWSLPISLESLCFTLLTMIASRFVATFGAGAIATQRVGSQIESLSWLIGGGFASALTAYIGQNFGAQKWGRIHKGFQISTVVMIIWGLLVTAMLFFGARPLFSVFISEPDIIDLGVDYLRIFALVQLATCLESIAAGAFRGVGKTNPPSIVSISCNALRVPLAYVLSLTPLGLNGIWIGLAIGNLLRGVLLMAWYTAFTRKQPNKDLEIQESPQSDLKSKLIKN